MAASEDRASRWRELLDELDMRDTRILQAAEELFPTLLTRPLPFPPAEEPEDDSEIELTPGEMAAAARQMFPF